MITTKIGKTDTPHFLVWVCFKWKTQTHVNVSWSASVCFPTYYQNDLPPMDKMAATLEEDTFKRIFLNENEVIFWLEFH